MARYIDADALTADVIQSYTANADVCLIVRKILDDVPAADVEPRAELEAKIKALNTDFDDVEEVVSLAFRRAKELWNDAREDTDDTTKAAFFKGRWSAFKDVLELMSTKGE